MGVGKQGGVGAPTDEMSWPVIVGAQFIAPDECLPGVGVQAAGLG